MMEWNQLANAALEAFPVSPTNADNRPIVERCIEWAGEYAESDGIDAAIHALESMQCSGCYAPSGLIYNHDIAARVANEWDDIDDALDQYRDATGESFAPESVGQLVWFAYEWWGREIAAFMRSQMDDH